MLKNFSNCFWNDLFDTKIMSIYALISVCWTLLSSPLIMKWLRILPWSFVFGVRLHTISKLFFSSSALFCGGPIVICLVILLSNCTVHLSHISVVQSMLSPFTKSGLYMYITNNAFRYKVCNDLEPSLLVKGKCHSRHLFKNYGLN